MRVEAYMARFWARILDFLKSHVLDVVYDNFLPHFATDKIN